MKDHIISYYGIRIVRCSCNKFEYEDISDDRKLDAFNSHRRSVEEAQHGPSDEGTAR